MTPGKTFSAGPVLATLAALCWGAATVMSKSALDSFPPIFLLVLQLIASVVFLWVYIVIRNVVRNAPMPKLAFADVAKFASLGFLEPGLAYLLGLIGLSVTGASNAVLIQATEAIMIIAVSAVLFRERPKIQFVAFSLVAVGGLLIALGIVSPGGGIIGSGNFSGDALIFAGTLAAAFYVVISGRFASKIDPVYIVAWQQTVALGFALLLLPIEWMLYPQTWAATTMAAIPRGAWVLAFLSGIVQYALAFSLYITALKTISANYAGSFLNLVPLFGLVGAFLFLHETLSLPQLAGAAVTILAVTYINLRIPPATH